MKYTHDIVRSFAFVALSMVIGCAADTSDDEVSSSSEALANRHYLNADCGTPESKLRAEAEAACKKLGKPAPIITEYRKGDCRPLTYTPSGQIRAGISFTCGSSFW